MQNAMQRIAYLVLLCSLAACNGGGDLADFRQRPAGEPEVRRYRMEVRGGLLGVETWSSWPSGEGLVLLREQTIRYLANGEPVDRRTAEWCVLRERGLVVSCEGRDDRGMRWSLGERAASLLGVWRGADASAELQVVSPRTGRVETAERLAPGRYATKDSWVEVDSLGWLRVGHAGGFTKRRVETLPGDWQRIDPSRQLAVPVARIERPRGAKHSAWLFSGVEEGRLPVMPGRQWVEEGRLHVRAPLAPEVGRPPVAYAGDDPELIRLATPQGSPALAVEAQRAIGGAADRKEALMRLVSYVSTRLTDSATGGEPTATGALQAGVGDCNDHARLLVSLARELAMPARVVTGLAYVERDAPLMVPHVWVEVWMERPAGWVPVDSSFDQWIADATHIVLGRGTLGERAQTLTWSNALALEVVDLR